MDKGLVGIQRKSHTGPLFLQVVVGLLKVTPFPNEGDVIQVRGVEEKSREMFPDMKEERMKDEREEEGCEGIPLMTA